jgi:alkylated DNA repair dioxygenase AlkB
MANVRSITVSAAEAIDRLGAWQPSLFGGAPTVHSDPGFVGLRRIDLGAGAWVDHCPGWVRGADGLFERLVAELPWERHTVTMYDRLLDEPRLTQFRVHDHLDRFPEAAHLAAALSARYDRDLARIGAALYRDGNDSVAWHGDRTEPGVVEPLVAIVSLGATRALRIRPRGGGRSQELRLRCGDLVVMGGTMQHTHEHCVPKTRRAVGPRLSLMFRDVPVGAR